MKTAGDVLSYLTVFQYRVEFMSAGCVRILSFPEGDTLVTKRLVVDSEKAGF